MRPALVVLSGCCLWFLASALSYAREAHRIRSKLLQEKFIFFIERQHENLCQTGETILQHQFGLTNLQILKSIATAAWPYLTNSWDLEGCVLSPWNVLQCYLESTLSELSMKQLEMELRLKLTNCGGKRSPVHKGCHFPKLLLHFPEEACAVTQHRDLTLKPKLRSLLSWGLGGCNNTSS